MTTSGIIFGIIAMLGYGLGNAISKVPAKEIGASKTVFLRTAFTNVLYAIVLIFFWSKLYFDFNYIIIAFAISFIGYIPLFTFYKALEKGRVGVISPIANSSLIFTVLFSVLFFGESFNIIQALAIIAVLFGIFLISSDFKGLKGSSLLHLSSGVPYALVSCFLWGLVFFLFKIPVNVLGPILTAIIIELGVFISSAIHLKIRKGFFSLPSRKILVLTALVGFFTGIGTLFFNLGISISKVSIVAAIAFTSPLIAVLYGKFVYKEKLRMHQWLAVVIILCGIVLISSF